MNTITREQACAILAVKPATLYSYVSRGLIRSVQGHNRRSKRYLYADILQLANRAASHRGELPAAQAAMKFGPAILTTEICEIDPDGPYYRGHSALGFAERHAPFEEIIEVLWGRPLHSKGSVLPTFKQPSALLTELSRLCLAYPNAQADELYGVWLDTICDLSTGSVGERVAAQLNTSPAQVNLLLTLCADHGLTASTFSARVCASAKSPFSLCILSALCAFRSPRHGLCSLALLGHLISKESATKALTLPHLPGFSHPLYSDLDPRALYLIGDFIPNTSWGQRLQFLINKRPDSATLDVGLLVWCDRNHVDPTWAPVLFALARFIGWTAHIEEQQKSPTLLRPRARYKSMK